MSNVPEDQKPEESPAPTTSGYLRLFLDDDPARAGAFMEKFPDALWVKTALDCIEQLSNKNWDEIHLDHDLEGEWFVDSLRQDCGMEVVRWLTAEPRKHLMAAKFVVHSHNQNAAMVMVTQLGLAGYYVIEQPFGSAPAADSGPGIDLFNPAAFNPEPKPKTKKKDEPLKDEPAPKPGIIKRILRWFVPPPAATKPWNQLPGPDPDSFDSDFIKPGRKSRRSNAVDISEMAKDTADDSTEDDDSPGPFVFPFNEDNLDSFQNQARRPRQNPKRDLPRPDTN